MSLKCGNARSAKHLVTTPLGASRLRRFDPLPHLKAPAPLERSRAWPTGAAPHMSNPDSKTSHTSLAEALVAFQAEAPKFAKNKTAKVQTKTGGTYTYKYADLGDILPIVGPLLAKHGLSWSSRPGRGDDGELVLRYRLLHSSGEADADEMPLGVDRHCRPQELGSAITYARRYAITAQLNLTTDEDDDAHAAMQSEPRRQSNVIDKASLAALRRVYKETGWTEGRLHQELVNVGVQNPTDIAYAMARLTQAQATDLLHAMESAVDRWAAESGSTSDPVAPEL